MEEIGQVLSGGTILRPHLGMRFMIKKMMIMIMIMVTLLIEQLVILKHRPSTPVADDDLQFFNIALCIL